MKYERTDSFARDFKRLQPEHKTAFRAVVRDAFAPARDAWAAAMEERVVCVWPKSLRIDELVGAPGIMEMTWSSASPAGRATFALRHRGREWHCVWRRVGDHDVFANP